MQISLETLLNILFTNGMENVVSLAVKIDAGIIEETLPENLEIPVSVYREDLLPGTQMELDNLSNGTILLPVIKGPDKYSLNRDMYYVRMPKGNIEQKSKSGSRIREVIPCPPPLVIETTV